MPSARAWREYPQRYRYEAAVCDKCGKWHFPPRLVCECGSRSFTTKRMGRLGKILSYTVIRVPPAPFKDQAPYAVAIVEMDEGPRITTMVADVEDFSELAIGKRVKLEFRKIYSEGASGINHYGYKAVLIDESA